MAELKRPLYFTGQLLVQGDFQDEQGYHVRLRRLHNSLLHTAGVMTGLDVAKKAGTKILTVQPGVAIDGEGREIVVDVTAKPPELDLNQRPLGPGFLIIKWVEVDTDPYTGTGPANTPTRKTVRPELDWVASVPDGAVKLASGNNLANDVTFDSSIRSRAASVTDPAGTLVTRTLKLSIPNSPEAQWPSLSASAANTVSLAGSLSVTGALSVTGGASVTGALSVAGTANVTGNASVGGKFGIGTTNPQSSLDIATGLIHVGGSTSQTIPNVQGAHISWNRTNGIGETDFINHRGSGPAPGGFAFLNTNDGTAISSLMFIAGTGNVGVGTTDPKARLDVADTSLNITKSILARLIEGNTDGTTDVGTYLGVKAYNTQPADAKSFALEHRFYGLLNNAINFYRGGGKTGGRITFGTGDGTENVTIDRLGNMGIGVTAPTEKLHVEAGTIVTNGENQGLIIDEGGRKRTGLMKYQGKEMMLIGDSTLGFPVRLGRWTGGTIKTPASVSEDLVISSSGNVGIGTGGVTQPAARLQVVGGAIMPAVGSSAQAGIQFPSVPDGDGGDEAFIRYFVVGPISLPVDQIGGPAARAAVAGPGVGIGVTPLPTGEVTKLLIGIGDNPDDTIGFKQAGAERMTISNGTVGIGTPSPAVPGLHIGAGVSGGQGRIQLDNVNGQKGQINRWTDRVQVWSSNRIQLSVGGTDGTTGPDNVSVSSSGLLVNGDITITGSILGGAKGRFLMDEFVNALMEPVEEGDVVVIEENQTSLFHEPNNNIPVPEIDLTQRAYDTRVCGVVFKVFARIESESVKGPINEAKTGKPKKETAAKTQNKSKTFHAEPFTAEQLAAMDRTRVEPGQTGWMVTLGTFGQCKVDADIASIKAGDLLTTSPTKGHAQKVLDPTKATGAIIGKALGSLKNGKGKIPVLVTLQ